MMTLFDNIEIILFAGIASYMWCEKYTMPGEIAGKFRPFVMWILGAGKELNPFQYWVTKITFDCAKCVAGFWTCVIVFSCDGLEAAVVSAVASSFVAELLVRRI
jgi:hypothetical protein